MNQRRSPLAGMTPEQRARFWCGRDRYQHRRRVERDLRRSRLAEILRHADLSQRGWMKEAAETLGVSRWTLRADLVALAGIAADARRERTREREALQEAFQHRLDMWVRGCDRDDS